MTPGSGRMVAVITTVSVNSGSPPRRKERGNPARPARAFVRAGLGYPGEGAGHCLLGGHDRVLPLECVGDGAEFDGGQGHCQRHYSKTDPGGIEQQISPHLG